MKIYLQIILVFFCVIFLLMSACGGFFLFEQLDPYVDRQFAAMCFWIGGGMAALMIWLFRRVTRKKKEGHPA